MGKIVVGSVCPITLMFTHSAVDCGVPPTITNGSPGAPTPGTTLGGMVTYTCTSGVLVGGATVTCEASGVWSTTPTCLGEHATGAMCNRMFGYTSEVKRIGVF